MITFRHPRAGRAARVALGLAAALSTTALGVAAAAPAAVPTAGGAARPTASAPAPDVRVVAATHDEPCLAASSAQRVRVGSASDGADPNTLSLGQTEQAQDASAARTQQRRVSAQHKLGKTTIPVYVHVITTASGKGDVSTERIEKQISVLNKAYAGKTSKSSKKTPFRFELEAVDRTARSDWYSWAPPTDTGVGDDVAPKTALHRGGFGDLNLYVAALEDGVLGYSSFPWDTTLPRDGVVLLNSALPGGSAKGYDKGDTATHEVGHWLGLLHTFQNGCAKPGDLVSDTPYQADGDNIFSCSSKLNTCRSKGKDPVHNFMSYGDDKCLSRFTKGQVSRMSQTWQLYRAAAG
ncbi:zinc metalloprotease [Microlunatus flavus]|uniref:Pregnancy-associated plasma protein-A n=1 Tax=Microlunatus flavus TaxID=1036181 RepID=A0A1H8YYN6_9ACTN|nr:zinc metalloprotease [Microlunatus flavus]SEP57319.1 Pregnancy-associated plasma protein-A [Microlunatus flavus]